MKENNCLTDFNNDLDKFIPGQSIDCVIIGFDEDQLKLLILKWKEKDIWSLPGGFIYKDEDMSFAATRILNERTGIELPFLEQFKTFGKTNRNNQSMVNDWFTELPETTNRWFNQRFISTGYLSLVPIKKCNIKPDFLSEAITWIPINELPDLIFDHNDIVKVALDYVKNQINYLPVGLNLLPNKFTMRQLQQLYESILQKKLDRGNFQRKMLSLGIFIRHDKQREGGAHKAPYLYSFDIEKYNTLLKVGIKYFS